MPDAGQSAAESSAPARGRSAWAVATALILFVVATWFAMEQAPHPQPHLEKRAWVDSLLFPLERNPSDRREIVIGQLNGVASSPDGKTVVAVGENGVVLNSLDAGANWTFQPSNAFFYLGPYSYFSDVSLSGDGKNAVAVGLDGAIHASDNSGQSWVQVPHLDGSNYSDVSISSNGVLAIAVGDDGVIHRSVEGVESWIPLIVNPRPASPAVQQGMGNGEDETALSSGPQTRYRGVSIAGDGRRVIVVGADGVILSSENGGARWEPQTSGTTETLNGVALSFDGQFAIAVGTSGVILASPDRGKRWIRQSSGTTVELVSISLSSDGKNAVAVGSGGTILVSTDQGKSWKPQRGNTAKDLHNVSLSNDGLRAVAVGDQGVILSSPDGGQSWTLGKIQRLSNYSRYPAPWYYLILSLCFLIVFLSTSGRTQTVQTGAAAMAATDSPTISPDQDRLDFTPLARGISRFLCNTKTEPPLTLAITGEWGTGKSSLMGLVCADLRANRWRPVWFNAWHHQNEEQLLAALLVAVSEIGVPPLLSLGGIGFRLRLLVIRAQRHRLVALLVLTVISMIATFWFNHRDGREWHALAAMVTPLMKGKFGAAELGALSPLLPILAGIGVIVIIGRTIKAFGVDPAVLLSSTMAKFRLKDASAQTSFRMRFAKQFRDVTAALAYPMVIVIDDLDRCQPEIVLQVMEAVNFLTSSGKCFVIFGMATQRVQAALALSFKEIAGEFVALDTKGDFGKDADVQKLIERKQRHEYARQYLEKLVNLEIVVPDRSDLPPSQLLETREPATRTRLAGAIALVKRWQLLPPAVLAMVGGIWLATLISLPEATKLPPSQSSQNAASAPATQGNTAQETAAAEAAVNLTPSVSLPPTDDQPAITLTSVNRDISLVWFLIAAAGLLGAGLFFWLRWYRRKTIVQDTEAFNAAMEIWSPIATFTNPSPRSIKRFGNRIRYLAMLQQGEQLDEPPLTERLLAALTKAYVALRVRLRPSADAGQPAAAPSTNETAKATATAEARALALSEHRVVALGAMHAHFGPEWRSNVENSVKIDWRNALRSNEPQIYEKFKAAVGAYRALPKASWPPSPEELDAFERSLKGVRLPGDGLTFDQAAAAAAERSKHASPEGSSEVATDNIVQVSKTLVIHPKRRASGLGAQIAAARNLLEEIEPTPTPPPASPTPQPRKRRTPPKK